MTDGWERFEDWYTAYHPRLVTVLVGITGDRHEAIDAADEALVRALERWDRVSAMDSPEGWTYAVALNLVRRSARRRSRRRDAETRARSGDRTAELDGANAELWALVAGLPERQRTAVVLRTVAGLTEPEIATVMGVARGTVSSTLRAAYASLRIDVEQMEERT